MHELRKVYIDSMPAKIRALETGKLEYAQGNMAVKESLKRISHSLRGSGGTYSFPEITDAAAALEESQDENTIDNIDYLIEVLKNISSDEGSPPTSILIIDDDPMISRLLEIRLSGINREIYVAATGREAQEILERKKVSLIILDLTLPDLDGRNLLLSIREEESTCQTPVVILSAKGAIQAKTECFALGADDYFEKPFDVDVFAATVSAIIQRVKTITVESKRDTLTGLPNRGQLKEYYEHFASCAKITNNPCSVSILDIDKFKTINDTHGHGTGDMVIQKMTALISRSLRESDIVARWGGDECVILLSGCQLPEAVAIIEKILASLGRLTFTSENGVEFNVTFSAGVVEIKEIMSLDDAVNLADKQLYRAKTLGRNCIVSKLTEEKPDQSEIPVGRDVDIDIAGKLVPVH